MPTKLVRGYPNLEVKKMYSTITPKIYVACLAAYNNGYLHGEWIDATQDVDSIYSNIRNVLASSPIPNAEEWAIHDYEDFHSISISENEGVESSHEKALFALEHGEVGTAIADYYGGDLEDAKEAIENNYHGEWDSELDFATDLFDECYAHDIPENLRSYIDYEQFCRDIFINDYLSLEVNHKVHVISYH